MVMVWLKVRVSASVNREQLLQYRGVVVPPHRLFGLAVADDELVLGAAPGVRAGLDHQRPVLGAAPFPVRQRGFRQLFRGQVGVDRRIGGDALIGERMGKRRRH